MIFWQKLEREGVTKHIVKNRSTLFCMIYYSIWPIKVFEGCLQLKKSIKGTLCLPVCTPDPQKVIRTSWDWAVPSSEGLRLMLFWIKFLVQKFFWVINFLVQISFVEKNFWLKTFVVWKKISFQKIFFGSKITFG